MSAFSEQNARLLSGLRNAKAAVEEKSGSITLAGTSPTIEEIVAGIGTIEQGGGSGGQDYFALLEAALATTAADQPYRNAFLVSNANDTFSSTASMGNSGAQWWTSDGAYYSGNTINHTWDKTKDTEDGYGFGSRWIIYSRSNENGYCMNADDVIFCVIDDGSMSNNACFKTKTRLLGVKWLKPEKPAFASTITSLNYAGFNGCNSLQILDGFNGEGITTFGNGLQCGSIGVFKNITNITSELKLTANLLDRQSLINLMNALGTTSTEKILTVGAVCLERLTDADKAIATGKGWTLA